MKNTNIQLLYESYPIIKAIDEENQNIIGERAYFKSLKLQECFSSAKGEKRVVNHMGLATLFS
ncbi:hypothetical protein [Clostridium sp. SM-530-WT-3G]|uniref:hypothetical protein n=1 Tax=Clostridium sp. SM-530-WT-3G TaxID=2725303 RepID=UPI00145ED88B|nr:hypothetical protein [Clostridium sp. SM-530-WT-3G]NME81699.1 hypothetical protein [Clostridium sp. SM-530-WT-3G]